MSNTEFDEIDAETEDIEGYLERLQEYFTAYDIDDDEDNAAKRQGDFIGVDLEFQRARPVPYALSPVVEKELKRMEAEGFIEPVEVSGWATPIVSVPKSDGSVRVCGDYKGAVNPAIQMEAHISNCSWMRLSNCYVR